MKVLLDTHVFLWAITDAPQLSMEQRELFLDEGTDLYLSVVSVWEMLIKAGLGKLPIPQPETEYVLKQMERNRIALLPIRMLHFAELQNLPALHRDPFDRMLVAQARAEKMKVLTSDARMRDYGV
jgi:PIN domain nuclease of toxin-antitoxin system